MAFIFIESKRKIIAHFYCVTYYFDKREIVLKNWLMTIFLKRLYNGIDGIYISKTITQYVF